MRRTRLSCSWVPVRVTSRRERRLCSARLAQQSELISPLSPAPLPDFLTDKEEAKCMMVAEVKLVLDSKLATDTSKGEATSTTRTQCVPPTRPCARPVARAYADSAALGARTQRV